MMSFTPNSNNIQPLFEEEELSVMSKIVCIYDISIEFNWKWIKFLNGEPHFKLLLWLFIYNFMNIATFDFVFMKFAVSYRFLFCFWSLFYTWLNRPLNEFPNGNEPHSIKLYTLLFYQRKTFLFVKKW